VTLQVFPKRTTKPQAAEECADPSAACGLAVGIPKITDFGLAKRLDQPGQTQSGAVMGTPSYMAPEQAAGKSKDIGPAADVYALGAILYECLTGRPPFVGTTAWDTVTLVLTRDPVAPRRRQPGVPRDLETICLKCLHKDPYKRYASAADLADDLHRYLAGEPIRARPAGRLERAVKWARRRPTAAALVALAGVLLLAAAGSAWWYWDAYRRLKVGYYAGLRDRRGVWEGVGRLSEDQARHRRVSYKFFRRAGRVEKVEVVNGFGALTPFHSVKGYLDDLTAFGKGRECSYTFAYNEQGQVTDQVARDRDGQVVWTFHFTTPTTGHYTDARGFPHPHAGSGATYVEFDWTEDGLPREVRYLDQKGRPRCGRDGIFGTRQEFDGRGLRTRLTFLGPKGRPAWYKLGMVQIAEVRDDWNNTLEATYLDEHGKPALRKEGGSRWTWAFDGYGNLVEWRAFGPDGRPALHTDGYAQLTQDYDERGNLTEVAYFDAAGRPALHKNGHAVFRMAYDERGNVIATAYLGSDGRPTLHRDGYARQTRRYDERGNDTQWDFFGTDGKPALYQGHYARVRFV
jgi:YD repeat-containing protein